MSRAGFYRWLQESPAVEEELEMRSLIQQIVLEHRRRHGYRRVSAELRRRGMQVNHKRVARIMREDNTAGETKGTVETRPLYRIMPARSAPSQSIGIAVTPDTSDEIMLRAFDFRLNCIWSFGGCRRWDEILPSVEPLVRR